MKKTLFLLALIALPAFAQTALPDDPSNDVLIAPPSSTERPRPPRPPGRPGWWTCYSRDQFNRWFAASSWYRIAAAQGSVDYCRQYNPWGGCYFMGCEVR